MMAPHWSTYGFGIMVGAGLLWWLPSLPPVLLFLAGLLVALTGPAMPRRDENAL
jgi:hypothetical protein